MPGDTLDRKVTEKENGLAPGLSDVEVGTSTLEVLPLKLYPLPSIIPTLYAVPLLALPEESKAVLPEVSLKCHTARSTAGRAGPAIAATPTTAVTPEAARPASAGLRRGLRCLGMWPTCCRTVMVDP